MSPTPAINDPGNDSDRDEVQPGDIPVANLMALVDSSSDEDEQEENVEPGIGYQLLTPGMDIQGPAGPGDSDDDDDDDEVGDGDNGNYDHCNGTEAGADVEEMPNDDCGEDQAEVTASSRAMPHLQLPPLGESTELKELRDLWKTPRVEAGPTPMDRDHVDSIKSAMAGFSLPPSCLPPWATVVPETEWKAQLLSRLGSGKSVAKTTDSKCKKSVVNGEPTSDKSHALDSTETVSKEAETASERNGCENSGGGGGFSQ